MRSRWMQPRANGFESNVECLSCQNCCSSGPSKPIRIRGYMSYSVINSLTLLHWRWLWIRRIDSSCRLMQRNVLLNKEHGIFSIFKEAGLDLLLATSGRIQDSFEDSIGVFLLLGRMRHVNIHRFCWKLSWSPVHGSPDADFRQVASRERSPAQDSRSIITWKVTFVSRFMTSKLSFADSRQQLRQSSWIVPF